MPSALDLLSAAALLGDTGASADEPAPAPAAAPAPVQAAPEQSHASLGDIARAALSLPAVPPPLPPPPPQPVAGISAGPHGRQRVPSSSSQPGGLFSPVPSYAAQPQQPIAGPSTALPPLPPAAPAAEPSHGHGTRSKGARQRQQQQQQQQQQPYYGGAPGEPLQFFTASNGSAQLGALGAPPPPTAASFPPALPSLPALPPLPRPGAVAAPAPSSSTPPPWAVPAESGLIRCVCPYTLDDGFTIQCDLCNVWQHAACVGIPSPEEVPDEYRCEKCDPAEARRRGVDGRLAEVGMRVRMREMERVREQVARAEAMYEEQRKRHAAAFAVDEAQSVATPAAQAHANALPVVVPGQGLPALKSRSTRGAKAPRRSAGSAGPGAAGTQAEELVTSAPLVASPLPTYDPAASTVQAAPPVTESAAPAVSSLPALPVSSAALPPSTPAVSDLSTLPPLPAPSPGAVPAPAVPEQPLAAAAAPLPTSSTAAPSAAPAPSPAPVPSTSTAPLSAPAPVASTAAPTPAPSASLVGRKRRVAKQPKPSRATASASAEPADPAGESTEPKPPAVPLVDAATAGAKRRRASAAESESERERESGGGAGRATVPILSATVRRPAMLRGSGWSSDDRDDSRRGGGASSDDDGDDDDDREASYAPTTSAASVRRAVGARQPSSRRIDREREREREEDNAAFAAAVAAGAGDRYEDWRFEFSELEGRATLLWRDDDGAVRERVRRVFERGEEGEGAGEEERRLDERREAHLDATVAAGTGSKRLALVEEGLSVLQPSFVSLSTLPPSQPIVAKALPLSASSLTLPPIQSAYLPSPYSSNPSLHATSSAAQSLCPYPRATSHALFAAAPIAAGSFIAPLKGELVDLEAYRADPINQYALLGATKAGVRALPAPWSVAVDARKWGNEVRFARSGCHPNAVVRVVKLDPPSAAAPAPVSSRKSGNAAKRSRSPRSRSRSGTPFVQANAAQGPSTKPQWAAQLPDDPIASTFAVALFALTDIPKRSEIVLPWDWDDSHLVHVLPSLLSLPSAPPLPSSLLDAPDALAALSRNLALTTDALLGSAHPAGCACDRKRDCAVWWLVRGGQASCGSLTTTSKPGTREPLGAVMLNSFASASGADRAGFEVEGRKRSGGNAGARPVDLGALVGLERGWVVKEKAQPHMAQQREEDRDEKPEVQLGMDVDEDEGAQDDSPLSELQDLPTVDDDAHMEVDEPVRLLSAKLAVQDLPQLGISPSSALSSLPSDDAFSPARPARPSLADDADAHSSDSDLTEPLSNLSAQEDDDDDELSEVDESVLSPPTQRKVLLPAPRSPSPPAANASGPKKQKKRAPTPDDSSLSEPDEPPVAATQDKQVKKKKKADAEKVKAKEKTKKRKTARVYSSTEDEQETAAPSKGKIAVAQDEAHVSDKASASPAPPAASVAPTVERPRPKIGVKVVTKTVSVPIEQPKERKKLASLSSMSGKKGDVGTASTTATPTTKKKRPLSGTPSTLSSLKIRKLKDKKAAPKIRDQSDSEPETPASPTKDSTAEPTPTSSAGTSRAPSVQPAPAVEDVVMAGASSVDSASQNAPAAPAKEPTPPAPEPPKPPPQRLSFAAYRQRQMQGLATPGRPPPPPPPPPPPAPAPAPAPAASVAASPVLGVTAAQLEALAGALAAAASSSPAASGSPALPGGAPLAASPFVPSSALLSETPPLPPMAALRAPPPPPPAPVPASAPAARPASETPPIVAAAVLQPAAGEDDDESEAGTPPLPPARALGPAPSPVALVSSALPATAHAATAPAAVKFSAADILKSIGDYFGSSSAASKAKIPAATTTPAMPAPSASQATQAASTPSTAPPPLSPSTTPPIPESSRPRQFSISLAGSALGLDAGSAAPGVVPVPAPASAPPATPASSSAPAASPMPGFRPISAQAQAKSPVLGVGPPFARPSPTFPAGFGTPAGPPSGPRARGPTASPAGFGRPVLPPGSTPVSSVGSPALPPTGPSALRSASGSPGALGASGSNVPLYAGGHSRPSPPVRPVELDPSVPTGPKAMQAGLVPPANGGRLGLPGAGAGASAGAGTAVTATAGPAVGGGGARGGWAAAGRGRGAFGGLPGRNPNMMPGAGAPRGRGGGWGWRGRGGGGAGRGGGRGGAAM
ncbi:uncharacterized protein JCM10292_007171 [Rhodotorula paludigena]|uniref:uncharacterized protein n=1 Tax=Rhodotorula paludigena TaxID=86838 RepID=UPI00316EF2E6